MGHKIDVGNMVENVWPANLALFFMFHNVETVK